MTCFLNGDLKHSHTHLIKGCFCCNARQSSHWPFKENICQTLARQSILKKKTKSQPAKMFSFVIRLIFTFVRSWWLLFWFCWVEVNLTTSNHLLYHSPGLSHSLLPPGLLQFYLIWSCCLTLGLQSILKFSSQVSPLEIVMSCLSFVPKLPMTCHLI